MSFAPIRPAVLSITPARARAELREADATMRAVARRVLAEVADEDDLHEHRRRFRAALHEDHDYLRAFHRYTRARLTLEACGEVVAW